MRATNGRGLQPAMDHILENEGKPVPDPSSQAAPSAPSGSAMDVDEDDEDAEALKAVYGGSAAAAAADTAAEAKVCLYPCINVHFDTDRAPHLH